jgi:hypothetical protein
MQAQLWIEPVGEVIIARMRGMPTEEILKECQERILSLVKDTQMGFILHDCLEMETPQVDVPVSQWKLDEQVSSVHLRRAVVVPDTKLAYLARLAFGEGDVRVFYNDMAAALAWLTGSPEASASRPAELKCDRPLGLGRA